MLRFHSALPVNGSILWLLDMQCIGAILLLCGFLNGSATIHSFDQSLAEREARLVASKNMQEQSTIYGWNRQSYYAPIRITPIFDDSLDNSEQTANLKSAMSRATEFWQAKLKVRRSAADLAIEFDGTCDEYGEPRPFIQADDETFFPVQFPGNEDFLRCNENNRPEGRFPNADLVVFVYYNRAAGWCKDSVLAVASPMYQSSEDYRPTMGVVNICKATLEYSFDEITNILKHEIGHILGYLPSLFVQFRANTSPNAYYDQEMRRAAQSNNLQLIVNQIEKSAHTSPDLYTIRDRGKQYFLSTPQIKKTARDFFNCSTLPGAPLEITQSMLDGSSLSHFDEGTVAGDLMSSRVSSHAVATPLTFAVFVDSGWYELQDNSDLDVSKFRSNYPNFPGLDCGCRCAAALLQWNYVVTVIISALQSVYII